MKFKCGECGKLYRLKDENIPLEGITIGCKECSNEFTITANNALISSSRNTQIICENCNHHVDEALKQCPKCNLILNKAHEELRIDNNYYESIDESPAEDNVDEKIEPHEIKDARSKMPVVAASVIFFALIIGGVAFLSTTTDFMSPAISEPIRKVFTTDSQTMETEVVILKTGETYYVKKITRDGDFLELLHLSGSKNRVNKQDVLSISKATIEKK